MRYTISQAAEKAGLSAHTLRYYDREGLLPFVDRSPSGNRVFEDSDFEWLELIGCLKNTGMQIRDISHFIALCVEGDGTLASRLALLQEHRKVVEKQLTEIQKHMKKIDCKIAYYEAACEAGTERIHRKRSAHKKSTAGGKQMKKDYLGADIKKLGFGLMRPPMLDGEIDIEQVKRMVDRFMERGFTYFDTAYSYVGGRSEVAAREAIVSRYPRDSFQLATKLPIWEVKAPEDLQKIVDTQLERTGAGYFDFYLLHSLAQDRLASLDKFGAWDFLKGLKERGIAKHIGFSFHDTAELLDELLTKHPEAEFVQLQINYADWDSPNVQSRACYEVARKHGKPVVIMEPVKGGALAAMTPEIQGVFKAARPDLSVPSWAVRYAASLEGIVTVLSGMSNLEQLNDNVGFMADFRPLDDGERKVVADVVARLAKIPTVPCTGCKYCVDDCPQKIAIPQIFTAYNNYKVYSDLLSSKRNYGFVTAKGGKASDCLQCGACEGHCPQHISIIETMKEIAKTFE